MVSYIVTLPKGDRVSGIGPAAPVLAGPVFLKVKTNSIFAKEKC